MCINSISIISAKWRIISAVRPWLSTEWWAPPESIQASAEVSRLGRATQGVKIMRVDEDANIIALAKVIKEDDDEEEDVPAAAATGETIEDNSNQLEIEAPEEGK